MLGIDWLLLNLSFKQHCWQAPGSLCIAWKQGRSTKFTLKAWRGTGHKSQHLKTIIHSVWIHPFFRYVLSSKWGFPALSNSGKSYSLKLKKNPKTHLFLFDTVSSHHSVCTQSHWCCVIAVALLRDVSDIDFFCFIVWIYLCLQMFSGFVLMLIFIGLALLLLHRLHGWGSFSQTMMWHLCVQHSGCCWQSGVIPPKLGFDMLGVGQGGNLFCWHWFRC